MNTAAFPQNYERYALNKAIRKVKKLRRKKSPHNS